MSDNLKLSVIVETHDEASPVIRKIAAEFKAFQKLVGKSFNSISTKNDFGASSMRAAAANHRSLTDGVLRANRDQIAGLRFKAKVEAGILRDRARDAAAVARSQTRAEKEGLKAIGETIRASAKLARQKVADEQAVTRAAARSIREKMSFTTRMSRQRVLEERAAAREAARGERERAAAIRETARLGVFRMRLRDRHEADLARQGRSARSTATRSGREAWSQGQDAYRGFTRTGGAAGIAATAGTGALVRKSLGVEGDIDAAEVNSRIYGGLTKQAARDLREKWAEPLAEKLGIGTSKLLESYVEALKLGIPSEGARSFAGLATKISEAWGVSFEQVSEILGTVNSILTSTGDAFDFGKIQSTANAIQYLAQKQSTTPEKLISFLQRGAGASQILGMSQSAGVAFGSASTSLGNQSAESGRLMDYVASKLIDLPQLVKKHGDEGKQARELVRALGYGSASDMDRQRRQNPDEFLPDFFERFNKISDPKVQERGMRSFFGREWLGEGGRMVKGVATYKESARLEKESRNIDSIEEVWKLHVEKLAFTGKQITSGFKNVLGIFGKELSPIARQFGDYFLSWTEKLRSGGLSARIKASLQGLVEGFGFRDVPSMLKGVLGDPNDTNGGSVEAWRVTFQEFAGGISDVAGGFKAFISSFTGNSPETISRWTGRILALSAALLVLSPVLTVIGGITSAILALGSTAATVWAGLKVAGLVGGSGTAGAIGAGVLATAGGIIGAAFLATIADKLGILKAPDTSKGWGRGILEFLDPGLASRVYGDKADSPARGSWQDPPGKALKGALDDHAKVLKQSLENGPGLRGLIHKTSLDDADVRDLKQAFTSQGARLQLASLTSGTAGGLGGSRGGAFGGDSGAVGTFGGSGAGGMIGNVPGQAFSGGGSRRGIIGGSAPQGTGRGTRSPANTGSMMSWAVDQLRREGVPEGQLKQAAAHLVGQATMESGLDPNKVHDGGTGYGIYGARDPRPGIGRRTNMLNWLKANGYAANSAEGQMREMVHSAMSGKYRRTRAILLGQGSGNVEADTNTITKEFESPKIVNRRSGAVQNAFNVGPNGSPNEGGNASGVNSASGGDIVGNMRSLRSSGRVINEQCVALAKAAVGVSGSVTTWRKGVGAEEGSLKPGTPIATFLDRQGRQSERYAGGGTGTMGANRDHAAVFSGYIRDKAGKIVGMNVADQWRGSGGVRDSRYLFGDRRGGAKDARNYHAILGSDGQPLGGERNPLNARETAGSPWSPGAGGNAAALAKSAAPTAESLAKTVPLAAKRPGDAMTNGGGAAPQVTIHQNIQGHHTTAESLANEVQKRSREGLSWRAHDVYHDV